MTHAGSSAPAPLVWVVDDSPAQAAFTESSLGVDYRVEKFADGANVVERLESGAVLPDLILCDWVMPGLSGDEVCRYVRQNQRLQDLPIVILTASRVETADIVEALETGANDYLTKPFVVEELRARVDSILRRSALEKKERATARFLEEMFAIVAHDLRTPLMSMHIGLGVLREEATPRAAAVITRLDRSTKRMTKIVEQLLDVTRSRIGAGLPVAPRPTRLREVVVGVLDELRGVHPEVELVLKGTDAEGVWDHDRLEQVVSNLTTNAIAYGRPGATIEIEITGDGETGRVIVRNELRDKPIPPATLATLFAPFERGEELRSNDGLGLGLYIVSEITRAHGGAIVAESDASGTRFTVSLPKAGPSST